MSLYGREHGVKHGAGGLASDDLLAIHNKNRLKSLQAEIYDLKNDPYFLKNHLGSFECRLCSTTHQTHDNYMIHTQGKKHKERLAKRQHVLSKDKATLPQIDRKKIEFPKIERIGKPAYQIFKQLDKNTGAHALLFRILYPQIKSDFRPRYRILSAYEIQIQEPSEKFQYVGFAADPYETVVVQIPNIPIERSDEKLLSHWNSETFVFTLLLTFKDGYNTKYHHSYIKQQENNLTYTENSFPGVNVPEGFNQNNQTETSWSGY